MQKPTESKPRKPKNKKKKPAARAPLPPPAAKSAASKQTIPDLKPMPLASDLAPLLYLAVLAGQDKKVDRFLEAGADANAVVGDRFTLENKHSLLYLAAYNGFDKIVQSLLASKASVNALAIDDSTPLHAACQQKHLAVVLLLLAAGAKADQCDADGETPLYVASGVGAAEIVSELIRNRVAVNSPKKTGATPLFVASQGGYLPVVRGLLEAGADSKIARTADKMTALHVAAHAGHAEVALLLVIFGADPDNKNIHEASARDYAKQNGHENVLAALQGHQAFFIYKLNDLTEAYEILCKEGSAEHRWFLKLKKLVRETPVNNTDSGYEAINKFINDEKDTDYIAAQKDLTSLIQQVNYILTEYNEYKAIAGQIAEKSVQPATAALLSLHFKPAALPSDTSAVLKPPATMKPGM